MQCPICGSELRYNGPWGYLASHQSGEVLGHTYTCQNADGFESEEEVNYFLEQSNQTLEDLGVTEWEEATCDSSMHHVSGSFYTDQQNTLREGYPC